MGKGGSALAVLAATGKGDIRDLATTITTPNEILAATTTTGGVPDLIAMTSAAVSLIEILAATGKGGVRDLATTTTIRLATTQTKGVATKEAPKEAPPANMTKVSQRSETGQLLRRRVPTTVEGRGGTVEEKGGMV